MTSSLNEVSRLLQQGRAEQADQLLQKSPQPDNPEWGLAKGRVLLRQGLTEEAYRQFEKILQQDPNHRGALFELAYALDLYGEDERAIELYEQLIEEPPLHVNALINLSVIYEDMDQHEEAEICLRKILEHYPNHARAKLFLKDVLSSKSMYYDEDQERSREKHDAVLDIPISDFELSVRSRNCLKKMNIHTLGDLLHTTEAELLSYKNFGETSLNEIKIMLRQKGLHLGQALEESFVKNPLSPAVPMPATEGMDPNLLSKSVNELALSVRSRKCLQRLGIFMIADLVVRTEAELLASKNFGQTSLNEIRQQLTQLGLSLRKLEVKHQSALN